MEKSIDSNHKQCKDDSSKISHSAICRNCYFSNNSETSRIHKKIASQECFPGQSCHVENFRGKKTRKQLKKAKLNVLNATENAKQSVQKKTKINKSNVPDRIGKYVSYSVRSETKFLLGDCKLESKISSNEFSDKANGASLKSLKEHSEMKLLLDGYTKTKLTLLDNECLNNKEAVSLRNSFESDLEKKNIFENFFEDCLVSTSKGKDASSQEYVNLEANSDSLNSGSEAVRKYNSLLETLETFEKCSTRLTESDKIPVKSKHETSHPAAPTKIKDHSNYYSSHKNIRHVCTYCQKIFKSNGKLNSHVYSHTGERPFDCSHCGKAFSSKFKLVRHLLIHSEIRKFVCQICDRTFLRNDHLKNHYKVHDPQKKMYRCPKENCDKEYSSIMSHKKHMAYHNVEDGDLKCLICNVKYETKEEILFHLKSHSGSRLFKSQSDKKFKCEFCERLFLTRKDVTRHLVVHTGERDFLCQFCPQRFGRKDHLVRHIKKSHGNEDVSVKDEEPNKKQKRNSKNSEKIKSKPCENIDKICTTKDNSLCLSLRQGENGTEVMPHILSTESNNSQTEECRSKTHIVITVQGKPLKSSLENRKRKIHDSGSKKKSFQKNECLVPKKKQVPLPKSKNSATEILFQNIPNILIIPNNSIILVRNQSSSGKSSKESEMRKTNATVEPEVSVCQEKGEESKVNENFTPAPLQTVQNLSGTDSNTNLSNINFSFDPNFFQSTSQFFGSFPDTDNFCSFQPDLSSFESHFEDPEQMNLEILNPIDLLSKPEVELAPLEITNHSTGHQSAGHGNLISGTSRQMKFFETETNAILMPLEKAERGKRECREGIDKVIFHDENEIVMLNETILNDLKNESSDILPNDGILNGILNQSNENCSFELLRNFLTSENPVLSPLPGFSQIFHNSNANSN